MSPASRRVPAVTLALTRRQLDELRAAVVEAVESAGANATAQTRIAQSLNGGQAVRAEKSADSNAQRARRWALLLREIDSARTDL